MIQNNTTDYDFVEIGCSNFDTLIQSCNDVCVGLSIDAVAHYINVLPNKPNIMKINCAITGEFSDFNEKYTTIYYIPEDVIDNNGMEHWYKGTNSITGFHKQHIKFGLQSLVKQELVKLMSIFELYVKYDIRKIKYLKIDTEGHDCNIMTGLFDFVKYFPIEFYPDKIKFESNELTPINDINDVIRKFKSLGYSCQHSDGCDTILMLDGI